MFSLNYDLYSVRRGTVGPVRSLNLNKILEPIELNIMTIIIIISLSSAGLKSESKRFILAYQEGVYNILIYCS